MVVNVDGRELTATKIIKSKNTVKGYDEEKNCVFIASGEEILGEYIEEITEKERLEALEQAMLEMVMGGM